MNLQELQSKQISILYAVEINKEKNKYYIVSFPVEKSLFHLPSGSAMAVYDGKGKLIDKTFDSGDDSRFIREWSIREGKEIDIKKLNLITIRSR